ncbi:unnamed protein product, partial [Lymnaea stagnalis]
EQLTQSLLTFSTAKHIAIKKCHGQSYDSASGMGGNFRGLQVRIKEMNQSAHCISCFAISLTIVGKCAAE